jgi:hypothetical protein
MKLSHIIAKRFEDKLEDYFEKEKVDPKLFPAENYDSCFDRAMDWIQKSFDETKDGMATDAGYAIAVDREVNAKDDTANEQAKLLNDGADPELGAIGFWNQ